MKFEVSKIGNEFELKFEIKENDSSTSANTFLIKIFAALILISSIYGVNTGDYTIFNSVMQTINKGIETIGKFALEAKIENTS